MSEDESDFSYKQSRNGVNNCDSDLKKEEVVRKEFSQYNFQTECGRQFYFTETPKGLQQLLQNVTGEKSLGCNGYILFENSPDFLKKFLRMEIHDDDVWVCTFPRSGTHWTLEMVWCILNDLNVDKARRVPLQFRCPFVEMNSLQLGEDLRRYYKFTEDYVPPLGLDLVQQMTSPRVIWTHMPYDLLPLKLQNQETKAKIIHVTRDVRDVCVSNYNFMCKANKYCSFDDYCKMFLHGDIINGPYWKHVLSYRLNKRNQNILFIEYEEMLQNLSAVITKVGHFLNKNLKSADIEKLHNHLSFNEMKNNPMINTDLSNLYEKLQKDQVIGNVIRAGKYGQWEKIMKPIIKKQFQKHIDYNNKIIYS